MFAPTVAIFVTIDAMSGTMCASVAAAASQSEGERLGRTTIVLEDEEGRLLAIRPFLCVGQVI
jgi:hypothetical protein